ncbi:MAG: MogA/MoaB family molybdenum cofactor biosynthesis protein [Proteobacteria bacterium]|nr:MogA/MoaB family molybdenum cofactor biosynthesis protein [Pseudomonadota bacterium]
MGTEQHRKESKKNLKIGIVTMSSTRTLKEDKSGAWMAKHAVKEGHEVVCHVMVKDNEEDIRKTLRDIIRDHGPQALILNGGTGITKADVTIEAVTPMFRKVMSSFAPIFSQLSYDEVDSAAIISRSMAGVIGETAVFCLPGSLKACKLACKNLIFPELSHVVKHILD